MIPSEKNRNLSFFYQLVVYIVQCLLCFEHRKERDFKEFNSQKPKEWKKKPLINVLLFNLNITPIHLSVSQKANYNRSIQIHIIQLQFKFEFIHLSIHSALKGNQHPSEWDVDVMSIVDAGQPNTLR